MQWLQPTIRGSLPSLLSNHTATLVGTRLIVFGGHDGTQASSTVSVLDLETMRWYEPTVHGEVHARAYHTATLVNKTLFVIGGTDMQACFNDVMLLNTETMEWSAPDVKGSTAADSPPPLLGHTATYLPASKRILVFGGRPDLRHRSRGLSDVYLLDVETLRWTKAKTSGQGITPRHGHTATLVRDQLFVFGGRSGMRLKRSVYSLSTLPTDAMVWTKHPSRSPGPSRRAYHWAVGTGLRSPDLVAFDPEASDPLWVMLTEPVRWEKAGASGRLQRREELAGCSGTLAPVGGRLCAVVLGGARRFEVALLDLGAPAGEAGGAAGGGAAVREATAAEAAAAAELLRRRVEESEKAMDALKAEVAALRERLAQDPNTEEGRKLMAALYERQLVEERARARLEAKVESLSDRLNLESFKWRLEAAPMKSALFRGELDAKGLSEAETEAALGDLRQIAALQLADRARAFGGREPSWHEIVEAALEAELGAKGLPPPRSPMPRMSTALYGA
eukprot:tig00020556_g10987.t1